jgi:glycosyltransferase involved in cell wall biosynthesis
MRSYRIAFLIRSLPIGGAERQLVNIAVGLRRKGHCVDVLVFYPEAGALADELRVSGIDVADLGKTGRWDVLGFIRRLRRLVGERRYDVVYSFLPTSNLVSALTVGVRADCGIIWGVRGGPGSYRGDLFGRWLEALQWFLKGRADAVITNSHTLADALVARGWSPERLHVVVNAVDASRFRFSVSDRMHWRRVWGCAEADYVIGSAGRIHPVKGLETLLEAVGMLRKKDVPAKLLVAGNGDSSYVRHLQGLVDHQGLSQCVIWLGEVADMAGFYSAIDVFCLASISEGRSNVLAEARTCGVPIVATRVGDARFVSSDDDVLVEPGDAGGVAVALESLSKKVASRGRTGMDLLQMLSDLERLISETESVIAAVVSGRQAKANGSVGV